MEDKIIIEELTKKIYELDHRLNQANHRLKELEHESDDPLYTRKKYREEKEKEKVEHELDWSYMFFRYVDM